MKNWGSVIPPSLFQILGQSELYPVYLDTLVACFNILLASSRLTYEQAREAADQVLMDHGLGFARVLPELDEPDDEEEGFASRASGRVLQRLQEAGWMRRETDGLSGEDIIHFPEVTITLLRAFLEISDHREVEYDALILSAKNTLNSVDLPRHRAIGFAYHQMLRLMDGLHGLIQQFIALRPDIERVEHANLYEWTDSFLKSALKNEHDNLRTRHSPERWFPEIVEAIRRLQSETEAIAREALKEGRTHGFDVPNPIAVRQTASQISGQLSFIERCMAQSREAMDELDRRAAEFAAAYNRRVSTALSSQTSEMMFASLEALFAVLQMLPKARGGGNPRLAEGRCIVSRFRVVSPDAITARRTGQFDPDVREEFAPEQPDVVRVEDIGEEYLHHLSRAIGPRAAEDYGRRLFGGRASMTVEEMLDGSLKNALHVVRLLDCCSMEDSFGFEIAWDRLTPQGEPDDFTKSRYRWLSNVTVRRKAGGN